ncbi:Serine/threonine protein kinase [Nonomuraea solani]|uniref:Serine/threonine protein kinase n=1 Tax=Nonomuraea solani TaxID=1144553 RepID=A0A1H5TR44_9ACTN|nr:serine/threonine-protein kinase [Nonomuraea solani]SEF64698.1 Serine/threonine protein kinase [Nonomuraea solani]
MNPPTAKDPAQIDGHRVLGRLGEGGQGVVYLGEAADGRRVAIKMLGAGLDDPEARARFRQEIGYARRVKAFCTAQVLASGELGGTPYVVSEYVDGPSLAEVIRDRGALRGAELRRLAIGTLTALAAIHQAGVVHRDFKPGNVLLSRDGPRVIDFGISRALEEAEFDAEHLVGTPPYMAPEQFAGHLAGPAADLFAWASTMVAAATGKPPFGVGDVPALIHRIMHAEPEFGDLDGEVRELAARCLAKDPRARPTATRALLTLLGDRVPEQVLRDTGEQRLLAEGQQSAAPPARVPGRRWWVGAAAVVTAVAVAGAVLYFRPAPAPPAAPTPKPVAVPVPRQGLLAPASVSELKIPETGVTLHENPADPAWVSSYVDHRPGRNDPSYVRDPSGKSFAYFGSFAEPIVSPGGGYVASLSVTRVNRTDYETILLRDRATGRDRDIRTVDKPDTVYGTAWSADGRRLLATVLDDRRKPRVPVGFLVIDPVGGSVTRTETEDGGTGTYAWGADTDTVLHEARGGVIRVLKVDGTLLRSFPGKGTLLPGGADRTPFGTVFTTTCPKKSSYICFWDLQTGAAKGDTRLPKGGAFHGWLDERHFMVTKPAGKNAEVAMMDTKGRVVRVLVDGPAEEMKSVVVWFTRK